MDSFSYFILFIIPNAQQFETKKYLLYFCADPELKRDELEQLVVQLIVERVLVWCLTLAAASASAFGCTLDEHSFQSLI